MPIPRSLNLILIVFLGLSSCKNNNSSSQNQAEETQRLVSLNGTITEIISQLGYQDQLVAVDVTSVYPEDLGDATNLGHVMNLSIEALLEQQPTQIFAIRKDLSADIQEKLNQLDVPVHYYDHEYSAEGAKKLIAAVAEDLQAKRPQELIQSIDQDLNELEELNPKPRVMFIYARGGGTLLVGGNNTPAASMIELAGATNAATAFDDYRPLTTEAVAQANPDVILLFETGLSSLGGPQGLEDVPGLATTTAVKEQQIISMDGLYLTGFGPRTGAAAKELNQALSDYAK